MTDDRNDGKIDSFTQGFVRKSARKLAGKHGFRRADRDEIEQRLYLKLTNHLHAAEPDDPKWKAFVATTVRRHVANMIRDNRAEKRDHRRVCSIHIIVGADDDEPIELAETIGEHEIPALRLRKRRSEEDLADLQIDMADLIAALPDDCHRKLFERLKYASIAQVARDMGIPRTTLNSRLSKWRQQFEECGLKEYL